MITCIPSAQNYVHGQQWTLFLWRNRMIVTVISFYGMNKLNILHLFSLAVVCQSHFRSLPFHFRLKLELATSWTGKCIFLSWVGELRHRTQSTTKYNVCRLIKIWLDLFGFGFKFGLKFGLSFLSTSSTFQQQKMATKLMNLWRSYTLLYFIWTHN